MNKIKKLTAAVVCMAMLCAVVPCITASAHSYSSDYRLWSQGALGYARVRAYGCFIVAMARMIVESGVDTSASFNPDVFAEWEEAASKI